MVQLYRPGGELELFTTCLDNSEAYSGEQGGSYLSARSTCAACKAGREHLQLVQTVPRIYCCETASVGQSGTLSTVNCPPYIVQVSRNRLSEVGSVGPTCSQVVAENRIITFSEKKLWNKV